MTNPKTQSLRYITQCIMIAKWAKEIKGLKIRLTHLELTRFTEAKRICRLKLKLAKNYKKNSQRGLTYLQQEMKGLQPDIKPNRICLYGNEPHDCTSILRKALKS